VSSLLKEVEDYIQANIGRFHERKLQRLDKLRLKELLRKKNPYLFKVKNLETAHEVVKALMEAFVSSQEETIFGDWLEELAIFVAKKAYGGRKSSAPGIDLEFEKQGTLYLVSIKSGPNWGNSSQIKRLETDFKNAVARLRKTWKSIVCVNGCCYGRCYVDKGVYVKICGQAFWELISGEPELYIELIEPLGREAKSRNQEYLEAFNAKLNVFVKEFVELFCFEDGRINWEKLVRFNSGKKEMED